MLHLFQNMSSRILNRIGQQLRRLHSNHIGYSPKYRISNNLSSLSRLHTLSKVTQSHSYAIQLLAIKLQHNFPTNAKQLKSFDQLFDELTSFHSKNGYIAENLFDKLINALRTAEKISDERKEFIIESVNFLHTLPVAERMKRFDKVWQFLKDTNGVNRDIMLLAMQIFQKNKVKLDQIVLYLNEVKNFEYDISWYEELVRLTCENGQIETAAMEILEEMRAKNIPLTNKIFAALILGHSRNKSIENCEAVFETMNAANLLPSSDTVCEMIRAYIENECEDKAIMFLNEKIETMSAKQFIMILESAAKTDNKTLIHMLMDKLPTEFKMTNELPVDLQGTCIELLYLNHIDAAFRILESFPFPNVKDNQDIDRFGQPFIMEMIRCDLYANEKYLDFCLRLIQSNRNPRALHVACETALRRVPAKAEYFLEALSRIEPLRPHYFWPLIQWNFKHKGEMGIFEMLKLMCTKLAVECDYETLYHHCFPYFSIIFKDIRNAIKQFENSGLKTSTFMLPLTVYLINQRKYKDVIEIHGTYSSKIDTIKLIQPLLNSILNAKKPNNKSSAKLIKVLHLKGDKNQDLAGQILIELLLNQRIEKVQNIFVGLLQEFALQNVIISKTSAELISSQLKKMNQNESMKNAYLNLSKITNNEFNFDSSKISDSHINHPRDMSVDELERHLLELEEKNLNTRGVLRRLLQLYVRQNQLTKALEVQEKCNQLNVHHSPGMLASILDLNIRLKNLENAKKVNKEITRKYPGFLIDEHKMIDLATLMIEMNCLEDARNLILRRTQHTKTVGGENISRNVWNLLNEVAKYAARNHPQDDEQNLTKEFFSLLRKYKFCQPQNVFLGPIIRENLLKNNIRNAVDDFKWVAESFRKTPLQLELMSLLVKLSNQTPEAQLSGKDVSPEEAKVFLQEIVTLTSKVHTAVNCNGTLLLAVIESGTESQLRKLLINPDFQFNSQALQKNIEYLNSNGRIESILKLARASRGIRHALNEQELYRMLLKEFENKNQCQNAIELYNKLEADDDYKISADFLKSLINLLMINKVELPNNIALRAQLMQ